MRSALHEVNAAKIGDLLHRSLTPEPRGSGRISLPVAWASARGTVRKENQDRLLMVRTRSGSAVAVLADGMGGMKGGDVAARTAVVTAAQSCLASSLPFETLLPGALQAANDAVFRQLRGEGGAAVVIAGWDSRTCYVSHAGDARAYSVGADGRLAQLTTDDTIQGQLVRLGQPASSESHLSGQLLQFVGMGTDFEPHVTPVPASARAVLLTSDGVHGMPAEVFTWIVGGATQLHLLVQRLITAIEWGGGQDNGTVIAVSLHSEQTAPSNPDVAEVWTPSDHIVVMSTEAPPRLDSTKPSDHRPRRKKTRKPPKRGDAPSSLQRTKRQKQLPIVALGSGDQGTQEELPSRVDRERPPASRGRERRGRKS